MIRQLLATLALPVFALLSSAAETTWLPVEQEAKEIVASKDVTVVHFWAPWCGNCAAEHRDNGWAGFIARNPRVRFVFIEAWNDGKDSRDALAKYDLGPQPNLTLLVDPRPRRGEGRMRGFMDLPVAWLPTTWVFREGRLCFAFNYGEIRFPMLQEAVDDASADW